VKIGLIDIDSKIPNIALMKLSAFHKQRGDDVEWWQGPLFHSQYDKVYASKVFDFTQMPELPEDVEVGGTGYDLKKALPEEVEYRCPDYSLYPDCDYSIGFYTRGCHRKCKFCKVPEKEGDIRFHQRIEGFENPKGKHWVFLDNNILAYTDCNSFLQYIIDQKLKVDFNQATDIRLVDEDKAKLLSRIKWTSFYRFSFDWVGMDKLIKEKVALLIESGLKAYKMFCFVLIGYNTTEEEDLYRVELLRSLKIDPFVMPYDKSVLYQKKFARWVNHKAIFKSVKWHEYN
jgi:hypothetical protein